METWVYILIIIALGVGEMAWYWRRHWARRVPIQPLSAGGKIVIFGDSLVKGVGASPGQDLVSQLSRRLNRPIINAGRPGDTAAAALERLEHDVLAHNPELVVVLLGGNDAIRRLPLAPTFAHLSTLISRLKQAGAQVVVSGVPGGLFFDRYARPFRELARQHHVTLVPGLLDQIFGYEAMVSDGIHPNDKGYTLMANRLEPVMRRFLAPALQAIASPEAERA